LLWSGAAIAQPLGAGPEFRVDTSDVQTVPKVAVGADRSFVVTWLERGTEHRLFAQRYDHAGAPSGGVVHLEEATLLDRSDHTVAADADGDFVVGWITPSYAVRAQRFERTGNARGSAFLVSEYGYFDTAAAMSARGDFVVAWSGSRFGGDTVEFQRYDVTGAPAGGGAMGAGTNGLFPAVSMRDDGGFVLV
jgi:hypothetical protein